MYICARYACIYACSVVTSAGSDLLQSLKTNSKLPRSITLMKSSEENDKSVKYIYAKPFLNRRALCCLLESKSDTSSTNTLTTSKGDPVTNVLAILTKSRVNTA